MEPFVEFEMARSLNDLDSQEKLSARIDEYISQCTFEGLFLWADWGSLAYAGTAAFTAFLSYELIGRQTEYDFALGNIDYMLGKHTHIRPDAPVGFSFLIGLDPFGAGYPKAPHHSGAFGHGADAFEAMEIESQCHNPDLWEAELTGALVGGPTDNAGEYEDNIKNYIGNEVRVYYNAGLAASLALLITGR